jgi:hypothetical protein
MVNHHWGWFEFRLCRPKDGGLNISVASSQECLNEHVLQFDLSDTSSSFVGQMMPGSGLKSPADFVGDTTFYK